MPEKRIRVWVQRFKDRTNLMLQWIDPDTNRTKSKSAKTADPKEAEDLRADLEADLNNGRYQDAGRITWEKFRERFEEEFVSSKRPATRGNYEDALDQFERLSRPHQLRAITERTLSAFVTALRKEPIRGRTGMAASSIKVRLQFLRTALRWAVDQHMLARCPKFPRVDVPEKLPKPIPAESFERILARAEGDPQMQAYLLCGWLAGLRLSEAYELEWEETETAPYVDLAHNRIILPAAFAKGKSDQWVPLDPVLREALLALPRHGKKVFRFISQRTKRPVHVYAMSDRVIRLAKQAGVRLTMHTLRKGFGCRYAGKVPAQVLQKLMRHRNIKTTMDYYANVDDAVMQAILGAPLNGQPNSLPNTRQTADEAEKSPDSASGYSDGGSVRS